MSTVSRGTSPWPPPPPPTAPRKKARWAAPLSIAVGLLAAAVVVAFVVLGPRTGRVEGHSMSPALQDDDRFVSLRVRGPVERGDIVCLRYPKNPSKSFVFRVVGLPGERLSIVDGVVRAGDAPIAEPYLTPESRQIADFGPVQLGADEYFVMGDRRGDSSDSREWGPVARDLIWCRVQAVWWRGHQPRR